MHPPQFISMTSSYLCAQKPILSFWNFILDRYDYPSSAALVFACLARKSILDSRLAPILQDPLEIHGTVPYRAAFARGFHL